MGQVYDRKSVLTESTFIYFAKLTRRNLSLPPIRLNNKSEQISSKLGRSIVNFIHRLQKRLVRQDLIKKASIISPGNK